MRRTPSLIHRGYLYAQKRVAGGTDPETRTAERMAHANTWRAGYLACERDRQKRRPKPCL